MTEEAAAAGVRIRTNAEVVEIDAEDARVILASGETVTADVLVGADGQHGKSRTTVRGNPQREDMTPIGVTMYE